jgi:hypothetical protein
MTVAQKLDLNKYLTSYERFSLLNSIKLFNLLLNLFDISFKKCQSIYLNAKSEEDTKLLSHANVETHNKQQQEQNSTSEASEANNDKLIEEKLFSENQSIKGFQFFYLFNKKKRLLSVFFC